MTSLNSKRDLVLFLIGAVPHPLDESDSVVRAGRIDVPIRLLPVRCSDRSVYSKAIAQALVLGGVLLAVHFVIRKIPLQKYEVLLREQRVTLDFVRNHVVFCVKEETVTNTDKKQ